MCDVYKHGCVLFHVMSVLFLSIFVSQMSWLCVFLKLVCVLFITMCVYSIMLCLCSMELYVCVSLFNMSVYFLSSVCVLFIMMSVCFVYREKCLWNYLVDWETWLKRDESNTQMFWLRQLYCHRLITSNFNEVKDNVNKSFIEDMKKKKEGLQMKRKRNEDK